MKIRSSKKPRPRQDTKDNQHNGARPEMSKYRQQRERQTRLHTWENEGGSLLPLVVDDVCKRQAPAPLRYPSARVWARLPRLSSMVAMCSPALHDVLPRAR